MEPVIRSPAAPEPAYYAEAYRLVEVLLAKADAAAIAERCRTPIEREQLARRFSFDSGRDLETAYLGQTATTAPAVRK